MVNGIIGEFYDHVQKAVKDGLPPEQLTAPLITFAKIAGVSIAVDVFMDFFVQHWTFRWRTALTNFYLAQWARLRNVEGASQRIQEDTQKFAKIMEHLGAKLLK